MRSEVSSQASNARTHTPAKTPGRSRRASSSEDRASLDARRRLEERLEDMRLQKEIVEFDFDLN